jgi:hypothetical protein
LVAEPVTEIATSNPSAEGQTPVQETPERTPPPSAEGPEGGIQANPSAEGPEGGEEAPSAEGAVSVNVEELPEWREQFGETAVKSEEPTAPELPGEPIEEIQARQEQNLARWYNQRLQNNDGSFHEIAQKYGLTPQEAHDFWTEYSPNERTLFQANAAHNRALFHESVNRGLPPESAQAFYGNSYRNTAEAVAAIHTLGEHRKDAEWQSKVAKGEYVTKATVKKMADAAVTAYRRSLEEQGIVAGSASNDAVRGTSASTGGRWRTKSEARSLHVQDKLTSAQMRAIDNDPRIPE